MANPDHLEIVKRGAKAINQWRAENLAEKCELIRANLRDADFSGAKE